MKTIKFHGNNEEGYDPGVYETLLRFLLWLDEKSKLPLIRCITGSHFDRGHVYRCVHLPGTSVTFLREYDGDIGYVIDRKTLDSYEELLDLCEEKLKKFESR